MTKFPIVTEAQALEAWRGVLSVRVSEVRRKKKERGEFGGGNVPYGQALAADGVSLITDAAEQSVIAEARELRAAGMSLRKVAEALDARGFRARTGRRFEAEQVKRMTTVQGDPF